jgi:hypothetical protein
VSISPIFYEQLFHTKDVCTAFMCLQFGFVIFWQNDFGTKAAHKMLVKLTPGINVKKLFFFVTDSNAKSARMFVPDKIFQPDLIFLGKARTRLSGTPYRHSPPGQAPGLTREY